MEKQGKQRGTKKNKEKKDKTKEEKWKKRKKERKREGTKMFAVFLLCVLRDTFVLDTCDGLCAHG